MSQSDPSSQHQRIAALEREIADMRRRTGVEDHPVVPPRVRRRSSILGLLAGGIVLLMAGGLAALLYEEAWTKVDGVFSSSGGALGRFDAHPTECRSGAAFMPQFLGADVGSEASGRLRVEGTGKAAVVTVWPPGSDKGRAFKSSQCKTFDVEVTLTGSEVNEVRAVDGHARLECRQSGKAMLSADVRFDACH